MSTQSHIDPPADPAAAQERPSRISRRSVLRGAAVGAGAVGLATVAGAVPAMASPRSPTAHAGDAGHAAAAGPIVVYLRDAASGELEVFAGDSLVKLHDPAIAARLSRAVR
jgi:hypothetical protein